MMRNWSALEAYEGLLEINSKLALPRSSEC
jgi:hypothetical protein